jgi:hypothetical protein
MLFMPAGVRDLVKQEFPPRLKGRVDSGDMLRRNIIQVAMDVVVLQNPPRQRGCELEQARIVVYRRTPVGCVRLEYLLSKVFLE